MCQGGYIVIEEWNEGMKETSCHAMMRQRPLILPSVLCLEDQCMAGPTMHGRVCRGTLLPVCSRPTMQVIMCQVTLWGGWRDGMARYMGLSRVLPISTLTSCLDLMLTLLLCVRSCISTAHHCRRTHAIQ